MIFMLRLCDFTSQTLKIRYAFEIQNFLKFKYMLVKAAGLTTIYVIHTIHTETIATLGCQRVVIEFDY